jgi:hypothetical protein
MNDEFYVGYLPKAPAVLSRLTLRVVACLLAVVFGTAVVLGLGQEPYPASRFEYATERRFEGQLETWPTPMLITADSHALLVAPGKHGIEGLESFRGTAVTLRGTLIQRAADRMVQVVPGSLTGQGSAGRPVEPIDLGRVRLRGEIVDSKCWLGVMNPGERKVHRDCAARCISGGIAPGFVVRDASGVSEMLLLSGTEGRTMREAVLSYVAEPVEISGQIVRSGSALILKASPTSIERLPRY